MCGCKCECACLPYDEPAACPGCTLPSPWDRWERNQTAHNSDCRIKGDRKWMDGWISLWFNPGFCHLQHPHVRLFGCITPMLPRSFLWLCFIAKKKAPGFTWSQMRPTFTSKPVWSAAECEKPFHKPPNLIKKAKKGSLKAKQGVHLKLTQLLSL